MGVGNIRGCLNPGAVMSINHGNETKPLVTSFRWDWGDGKRSVSEPSPGCTGLSHTVHLMPLGYDTIRYETLY